MQTDRVRYHVPIKFWVYRSTAGTGGPDIRDLRNYIDNLNRFYNVDNNTYIGFYMKCNIGYINDDSHLDVGGVEAFTLIQNYKEAGCINIHITNNVSDAAGVSYRARFFGVDAIFLSSITYTNRNLATTIVHEVGHYFELDHTHQFSNYNDRCYKEAINRNRTWPNPNSCTIFVRNLVCESTGDFLKDTPADPDLSSNNSCTYVLTGKTDLWGDHYETPPTGSSPPDATNLMSYNYARACRVKFSRLQIAVMLHSIVRGKSKGNEAAWKDSRSMYDDYESDNTNLTARTIQKGELQERNFHQQYDKLTSSSTGTWSNCDVDWVSFTPTVSETVSIATYQLPGYTTVNTRLTLFNAALTQLVQNDNISTTNLYSNISYNVVAGQTYFIRIENLSGNITGYYRLSICNSYSDPATYQINGPVTVCTTAQSFSVTNLPAGATVAWAASPTGILNVPPNGNPINVSQNISGTATLTATVTVCGGPFTLTKSVKAGGYSSSDYPVSGSSSGSCGSSVYFSTNQLPGATSYSWFYPSGWSASGYTTSALTLQIPYSTTSGNYQVGVRVANACDAGGSPGVKNFYVSCSGIMVYAISPNPATTEVTITPVNDASATVSTRTVAKNNATVTQVNIYDQQGILKKQQMVGNQKQVKVNVSSLRTGIYFIEIVAGSYRERQQLSVLR